MIKKIVEVLNEKNEYIDNMSRFKARNLVKKFKARYLCEDRICIFKEEKKKTYNPRFAMSFYSFNFLVITILSTKII